MKRKLGAFTLLELLVVLSVIGILFVLMVPTLGAVREKARRGACLSNLRQWGVALQLFGGDHDGCLPNDNGAVSGELAGLNWQNRLAPYAGIPPLADGNALAGPGDPVRIHRLRLCPSAMLERDMLNSHGQLPYAYGYAMNSRLDDNEAGEDANTEPFPLVGRVDNPNALVVVFTTVHYTLVGDHRQTVLQGGGSAQWRVSHRASFRLGGAGNLRGAGFQALFASGAARFVPIQCVFTNTAGSPRWITNHPQVRWHPDRPRP